MNNIFSNGITSINLNLRDSSGMERTEQITRWYFTIGSEVDSEIVNLTGEFIAPRHINIFQNGYKAFLEVLTKGFPVVLDGLMLGHSEKVELEDKALLKMGDISVHIRLNKNRQGSRKRMIVYCMATLLSGIALASGIVNTRNKIQDFHSLVEQAKITPSYEKRIDNLENAKAIVETNFIADWFVGRNEYNQTVINTLHDQYFITQPGGEKERKKIVDKARQLDVKCSDLFMVYETEMWAKKYHSTGKIESLPELEPNEKSDAFKWCNEVVSLLNQVFELRNSKKQSDAKKLIEGSPIQRNNSIYLRFLKPVINKL